jgi:SSS family solute:Na+ symporter
MADLPIETIDLGIIAIYFVVVLFIGFRVAQRTKSGEDLFLAGRSLSWLPVGLSLFASNISSTTLIGLAGAAYVWGIAVANYEWMAALVLVIFAVFFIPYYLRSRISTVPEFLEKRFDRRSRLYFSGLTLVSNIIVDTAGSLFAGAVVLQLFFPDLDVVTACIGLALVAGLYTAAGGLAAVVYTDVIQAVVLIAGSSALSYFTFERVGFSWESLAAGTSPEKFSFILPLDDPNLPWLGTLIGLPVLGFYFWCTNQFVVQRVLGARNVEHARWGALLAGLLKLPVLFIMVLPGAAAAVFLPDLQNGDRVFPTLVIELLPAGVTGLVLAGLVAAIMSSIDSTLNSASALLTLDFVKPMYPAMTPKLTARVGRIAIGFFMMLAALFAPIIGGFQGLFHYLQTALAFLVPPVVTLFVLGLFWQRASASGAIVSLAVTHAISAILFALYFTGTLAVHFTIIAGLLFLISCVIFVFASLLSAPPSDEQIAFFTYHRGMLAGDERQPLWQDYRLHAAVLTLLTSVLVIGFW